MLLMLCVSLNFKKCLWFTFNYKYYNDTQVVLWPIGVIHQRRPRQQLTFWTPPPIQHRPFSRHPRPPLRLGRPDRIARKNARNAKYIAIRTTEIFAKNLQRWTSCLEADLPLRRPLFCLTPPHRAGHLWWMAPNHASFWRILNR